MMKLHCGNEQFKIGKNVLENADFIRQLSAKHRPINLCHDIQRKLVREATTEQLFALVESCFNILRHRVPLTRYQQRLLTCHAKWIRLLSRARTLHGAKRVLLRSQRGRGLPTVAGLIGSILFPLISNYISKS
ncbi:MAG TPA: hypothetical protein VFV08_12410 [Puia sp.]|nr:hypothetical protein [Puia sp.]